MKISLFKASALGLIAISLSALLVGCDLLGLTPPATPPATGTDTGTNTGTDTGTETVVDPGTIFTFDETTAPTLADFGNNVGSIATDPAASTNKALKIVKGTNAQTWAGTTVSFGGLASIKKLVFDASHTKMTARVYSPAVGKTIRIKVESATDNSVTCETNAVSTQANAWETLTFDFATAATGTSALDFTKKYNKLSIFADFNVTPSASETFYFDDLIFSGTLSQIHATGISLPSTGTVAVGGTSTLTATFAPTDTYTQTVTWSSATPSKATVNSSSGVVTGVATGTSVITATSSDGSFTASCTVTVAASLSNLGVYSETNTVSGSPTLGNSNGWGAANQLTVNASSTSGSPSLIDGTVDISITASGSTASGAYGGILFSYSSGLDISAYSSLVFSINASGFTSFTDMGIKLESFTGGGYNEIALSTLTPTSIAGAWKTYTIPLSSYSNVIKTSANNLGFWNFKDSSAVQTAGTIYLDNIYFKP